MNIVFCILPVLFILKSMPLPSPTLPTTSLPVFHVPGDDAPVMFLPLPHNISALAGSSATLDCGVSPPVLSHTVSWLRRSDLSVLTVGSLVFTSDPRITVVTTHNTYSISIARVGVEDQGEYACQVNTRPRITHTVYLRVSDNHTIPSNTSYQDNNTSENRVTDDGKDNSAKDNHKDNVLKNDGKENDVKDENKMVQTYETVREVLENSAPTPTSLPLSPHKDDNLLLLTILLFSALVLAVIGVGSVRGLYTRWRNPKPTPARPRSRTGTIDSRRSSGSRRSQDSNQSKDSRGSRSSKSSRRKVKMREKQLERERLAIYEEIRPKPILLPLVQMIEPAPHWQRTEDEIENISNALKIQEINTQKVFEKFEDKYQGSCNYGGHIASMESLSDMETSLVKIKKSKNEKKIRFNPYDEFSE